MDQNGAALGESSPREVVPAPAKEAVPAPAKEAVPAPAKEAVPAPAKEAVPAPAKEAVPAPAKEAVPAPAKETVPAPAQRKEERKTHPYPRPVTYAQAKEEEFVTSKFTISVPVNVQCGGAQQKPPGSSKSTPTPSDTKMPENKDKNADTTISQLKSCSESYNINCSPDMVML